MFIIMFQISGLLYEIKVLLWSEFYMFGIQPIIFLPPKPWISEILQNIFLRWAVHQWPYNGT